MSGQYQERKEYFKRFNPLVHRDPKPSTSSSLRLSALPALPILPLFLLLLHPSSACSSFSSSPYCLGIQAAKAVPLQGIHVSPYLQYSTASKENLRASKRDLIQVQKRPTTKADLASAAAPTG